MSTFNSLVESTALYVSGFTTNQDQLTRLTSPVTVNDLTFVVADVSQITAGSLVEIDSELMWVESVNTATKTATVAPFGRGYRGTTAAIHSVGARVTIAPVIPRSIIERALNDTIRGVYPQVYGVSVHEFSFSGAQDAYPLPANAVGVLSISWDSTGPSQEWLPIRKWSVDPNASSTDFTYGKSVTIYDPVVPGRRVRVVYTHTPVALASGDNFSASGLRDAARDLVQFGAAARLMPWFDAGQAPGVSAEANYAAAMGRQSGSAATARYFTQMYQLRLQEEAAALHALYPIRSHYTR